MNRVTTALLFAVLLLASAPAAAEGKADYSDAQARYLETAKEYRDRADDLDYGKPDLRPDQQAIVGELVEVYYDLAEVKVAPADAIGAQDWTREEQLEGKYYALKDDEQRLWDELEATKK